MRSAEFDDIKTSQEIHQAAKQVFCALNVVMSAHASAGFVVNAAVVEFVAEGQPRRVHHLEPSNLVINAPRIGKPYLMEKDAQGNVIKPIPVPPAASAAQLWMRAAALDPEIASILCYLNSKPNWYDLYKAYEILNRKMSDTIRKARRPGNEKKIKLFTRTANAAKNRHHYDKNPLNPPKRLMGLQQARAFIMQWVAVVIDDILRENP